MNMLWTHRDDRLDIELAIALELGAQCLIKARTADQLDRAIHYNLRLWRAIRELACNAQITECDVLTETADNVTSMLALGTLPSVDMRDVGFVAGRNLALAGELVSGPTLDRGRDALIAEWAAQPGTGRFEDWLIMRLAEIRIPDLDEVY